MNSIIKIQSIIRKFLVRKKILIAPSKYQTKNWRQNRTWYFNGKRNECEKYQIKLIINITNSNFTKTTDKINIESLEIIKKINPLKNTNGFEWTENFDGKIIINKNIIYYNLKFVCDNGGAQIRTLREVYHFIKFQLEHIIKYQTTNIFFINILDGDTSYTQITKFKYLIDKEKYKLIKFYIFCGDMFEFQIWWEKNLKIF
jgi:hypothetical protein